MTRAKGRKARTGRRGFLALGLTILGAPLATLAADPPRQRARLPRRLAADFHDHIHTRLPHLREPFESAARETGFSWRMLAALGYQESRWRPAAESALHPTSGGIPKRIPDPDRTLLATAAYNIGIGHLEDARIITQMRKKNPDRWADVRANLPRLSDPRWHKRVKRGYANGRETVEFVERVAQFAAILESTVPDNDVSQTLPTGR